MTLCVVRRNRGLILHWQMGKIMAKIGLVLWWVLIISFRILLELGKKHRSFATLIFAWFGCLKSPKSLETRRFSGYCNFSNLPSNSVKFGFGNLTRNQVIPNGTEGSNPSLSAKNKGYSVCYTLYFFVDKTARDSNPYNLLQDEVLSKEIYNRIVCGANSRANEVSRIPHSPPINRT